MNRRITRMTPWVAAMLIVTIDLPNDDVSFTTLNGENGMRSRPI